MIDSLHSPLLESDGYAFSTWPGGELATATEEITKIILKQRTISLKKSRETYIAIKYQHLSTTQATAKWKKDKAKQKISLVSIKILNVFIKKSHLTLIICHSSSDVHFIIGIV